MTRRPYRNDSIYRIIGGVECERKVSGHFICRNRTALRRDGKIEALSALPEVKREESEG